MFADADFGAVSFSQLLDGPSVRQSLPLPHDVVARLRPCLTCVLCRSLFLTKEVVALHICGHVFCDGCINSAVENGFVEDEYLFSFRRGLAMAEGRPGKKRRRVSFSCPVCLAPAFKWSLTRVPLYPALCRALATTAPALLDVIANEPWTSPPAAPAPVPLESAELFQCPAAEHAALAFPPAQARLLGEPLATLDTSGPPRSAVAGHIRRIVWEDGLPSRHLADISAALGLLEEAGEGPTVVVGRLEWVNPADGDDGFWCAMCLTPALCTALVQGHWYVDVSWLEAMAANAARGAEERPTALERYAPRTWRRGGKIRPVGEPHNAFMAMLNASEPRPGRWIAEGGYGFLLLPDIWLQKTLRLIGLLLEGGALTAEAAVEGMQAWGGGVADTCAGFPVSAWERLICCAGGSLLSGLHLSLYVATAVYVLCEPTVVAQLTAPGQGGEGVAERSRWWREISRLLPPGQGTALPPVALVGPAEAEASPAARLVLLHPPVTERLCAAVGLGRPALPAARQHLARVLETMAHCIAMMVQGQEEHGSQVEVEAVDVRTTTWLLSNIAESRGSAGMKLATAVDPSVPPLPPIQLRCLSPDTQMTQQTDASQSSEATLGSRSLPQLRRLLYEDSP